MLYIATSTIPVYMMLKDKSIWLYFELLVLNYTWNSWTEWREMHVNKLTPSDLLYLQNQIKKLVWEEYNASYKI